MRLLTTTALATTTTLSLLLSGCAQEAETVEANASAMTEVQQDEPLPEEVLETEAETVEETSLAALPAGTYQLEDTHAYVTFSYSHLGFSNPVLRFQDFDAVAEVDPQNPEASTLRVTIDPASIDSAVEKFDEHLKSADMFDVATHPEITFVSTELDVTDGTQGTLTGDLTMKGVTKPVTLDVTLNGAGQNPMSGADTFGISATGTLDRSEWGLDYAAPAVGTEVDLRIEAEFVREEG